MIGHIAYAEGCPSPTLVLDAGSLPQDESELLVALTEARRWLQDRGGAHILKIALIRPSEHPLFDIDYRFVQALPQAPDRFDLRGSCGHSILSSVLVAGRLNWLPHVTPGSRTRVNVLNTGDHIVCEVDESDRSTASFTVHFLPAPMLPLERMLLRGRPTTRLVHRAGRTDVSLVSAGNAYVFVDAGVLGVHDEAGLFADDPGLFAALMEIRRAAALALGWSPEGVFPKVAALGAFRPGRLAARAISVPSWHPTLALTGLTCLTAAAIIPGTIPHGLARKAGCSYGEMTVDTPGGSARALAAVAGEPGGERLAWVSIPHKVARHLGHVFIDPLRGYAFKEEEQCLPLVR